MNASLAERAIDVSQTIVPDPWTDAMQAKAEKLFIENKDLSKRCPREKQGEFTVKEEQAWLQQLIAKGEEFTSLACGPKIGSNLQQQ